MCWCKKLHTIRGCTLLAARCSRHARAKTVQRNFSTSLLQISKPTNLCRLFNEFWNLNDQACSVQRAACSLPIGTECKSASVSNSTHPHTSSFLSDLIFQY